MEKCWTFPGPAEQGQWGLSGRTPGFFFFLFITIFFDLLYLPFTQGRKCCLVARAEELEFWALQLGEAVEPPNEQSKGLPAQRHPKVPETPACHF